MTTQDETLALARAWYQGDNTTFRSILKQIAAHTKAGSKRGDSAYIRALTVMSESTDTQLAEANTMIRQYVDTRPADTTHRLILPGEIREQIDRFIRERHEIGRLAAHGLAPASKILLTGAPGTGKTSLAREIAGRLGLPFAVIRLDRLIASRLGESLKNMGQLFDGLQHTPMVTLLDEADALLAQRGVGQDVAEMRRVTNLILQRLDQWDVRGVLVCATNLTAMLDPAALRRFDLRLDPVRASIASFVLQEDGAAGGRVTPFRLLDDDGLGLPASERERLWVEYCTATTRRRCFTWSHGVDA